MLAPSSYRHECNPHGVICSTRFPHNPNLYSFTVRSYADTFALVYDIVYTGL